MQLRFLGNYRDQHIWSVKDWLHLRKPTFQDHGVSCTRQPKSYWTRVTVGLILYCSSNVCIFASEKWALALLVFPLLKNRRHSFASVQFILLVLGCFQEPRWKGILDTWIITISIEQNCFTEGFFTDKSGFDWKEAYFCKTTVLVEIVFNSR